MRQLTFFHFLLVLTIGEDQFPLPQDDVFVLPDRAVSHYCRRVKLRMLGDALTLVIVLNRYSHSPGSESSMCSTYRRSAIHVPKPEETIVTEFSCFVLLYTLKVFANT